MSTKTRAELSKKNRYFVEKHRYYELKHFCLQYPIWEKAYLSLDGLSKRPSDLSNLIFSYEHGDPTARCAIAKDHYFRYMDMVRYAAKETDPVLCDYLILGVTEERSYESLRTKYQIPCCKEVYYELYRKFFYILNILRD